MTVTVLKRTTLEWMLWINPTQLSDQRRYVRSGQDIMYENPMIKDRRLNSTVKAILNDAVSLACQWSGRFRPTAKHLIKWKPVHLNYSGSSLRKDDVIHLTSTLNVALSAKNNGTQFLCLVIIMALSICGTKVERLRTNVRFEVFHRSSLLSLLPVS